MRHSIAIGMVATLLSASAARAGLVITEVMSGSDNDGNPALDSDWWELTNTGPGDVDLTGWGWDDTATTTGPQAVFGNLIVPAGTRLLVIEAIDAAEEASWRAMWNIPTDVNVINESELASGDFSGLGQGGDQVTLFNTATVAMENATFGPATPGVSFEWDELNNSLGLSVIGENGAYAAPNDLIGIADIGSPGTPVPEPTSLALACVGGLLLWRRR